MAPENDSAPSGSDASAVDEASAATSNPSGAESTGAGTNDPAAIAGADPAAAVIPPQGDPEAEAAAAEQAAAEQAAAKVAADEEAARIAEAEAAEAAAAEASQGEPVNPDPAPAPEAEAPAEHPEPSPVGVGVVQDNVTEPGVEHTGTRAGTSSHSTEHEGVPQTEEEIRAYRDKVIAEGEERDRLAGEGAPAE